MTGCKARSSRVRAFGGKVGVEVDGTIWSGGTVPVSGGPEVDLSREDRGGMSWEESSDFVLAFRVVKIKVRKKTGEASATDYKAGAMLGSRQEELSRSVPFHVEAADEMQAVELEAVGLDIVRVTEDDEEVTCVFPLENKG